MSVESKVQIPSEDPQWVCVEDFVGRVQAVGSLITEYTSFSVDWHPKLCDGRGGCLFTGDWACEDIPNMPCDKPPSEEEWAAWAHDKGSQWTFVQLSALLLTVASRGSFEQDVLVR
jgi:hypothetical protein